MLATPSSVENGNPSATGGPLSSLCSPAYNAMRSIAGRQGLYYGGGCPWE